MTTPPIPVVIGSGLTGLSISHCLSLAGVDHVLVGRAPGTAPRLGESMNLEGTLLLLEMYPQLSRFFFPKKEVLGYLGDYEVLCDFDVAESLASRIMFRALGHRPVGEFLQVDRLGFDAALWELATSRPHCRVLETGVERVEFDAGRDTFTAVHLEDGTELNPRYLFDGSNHGRLLGRATGMERRTLGAPQRVAYTHYHLPADASAEHERWELATVIVRLFPETDGLDAVAWCIPLGRYVSVGISMSDGQPALPDDALLERAEAAFARYGVRYRARFPCAARTVGLKHGYFVYERAAGANWVLAGPSFAQVWWLAGAGVGTSLAAAQLAPRLLEDPARWGAEYDRYMRQLVPIHGTFDYFALTPRDGYEPEGLQRFSDRFVVTNLLRLAGAARLRRSRLAKTVAPALGRLLARPGTITEYCRVRRLPQLGRE